MKKWLAFALLMITIAGTFIPCCSVDDCCADQLPTPSNHDKHQKEGSCSPFFACATCPGFVALSKPIQVAKPLAEKQVHHEQIAKANLSTFISSFWQPPRIG